ncbi:MAG: hypothetical protein LBQ40_05965 [Clostridiales bacterium]|jgi:stage III sporulation protein AG|nr:hypothetical protein [Clostridiales bacterium]
MVNQLVEKNVVPDGDSAAKPDAHSGTRFAIAFQNFCGKLRSVKHIKIIAAAMIGASLLLIFAAFYGSAGGAQKAAAAADPLRELETRLSAMLSEIKGAGKVTVMIMYDGGIEYVTANSTSVTTNKTTDNSGGVDRTVENTTETSTPVIITENGQSKPVIVKEIMPRITGVMIVASGADDVSVRMELARAAATILDVSSNIIEIFTAKK